MSLAVTTLTLIFLLAPGLACRDGYYSGAFSQRYFKTTFTDVLLAAIVPAVLIHVLAYYAIVRDYYHIDAKTIGILLSGVTEPKEVKEAFSTLSYNAKEIVIYLLSVSVIAWGVGIGLRVIIRGLRWDRKCPWMRFRNEWHYLFTGEILDFPGQPASPEAVDFVYVDALVDCDEGSVLYSGILAEHFLGKDGGLNKIYLSDTKRRYLKEDAKSSVTDKYYEMPGDLFVIPYDKIINLHVTYYWIEKSDSNKQPTSGSNSVA
jgi:hypothetical protein